MKTYHSIEKNVEDHFGKYVYGFDKIDGSNFRAEWNRKLSKKSRFTYGFGKFGTRNEMIKNANNPYTEGVNAFMDKYAIALDKIFIENKLFRGVDTITVYGEFFGEHSFAGQHRWDEWHDVVIFDMFLYKKDFLAPGEFLHTFHDLGIPRLVFSGILNETVIYAIKNNILGVKEGVVLKGVNEGKVFMSKVKTDAWITKVREWYGINNDLE